MNIKNILKIISTNWIHLFGFYVTTYLSLILFKILQLDEHEDETWSRILILSLVTIPLLFITYGPMIIAGFFSALFLLDFLGFTFAPEEMKLILISEWLILSLPFILWAFEYEYWLWLTLSISFYVTQKIRSKKITQIQNSR